MLNLKLKRWGCEMKIFNLFIILILLVNVVSYSQEKNKGIFVQPKNEYWDEISKKIQEFNTPPAKENKKFKVDFSGLDIPKSIKEFKYYWHNTPENQGQTGTCWSFSTTSFFESEIYRIHNKKLRLSPIWNAYWEYIEKATRFINERGNSHFAEGSEANALKRLWKKYGVVPLEAYSGKLPGQVVHDHSKLIEEMTNYLNFLKTSNAWNLEVCISTIKSILNKYLGTPPEKFTFEGKEYTPKEFFQNVVKLNMDDYIDIISLKQSPYYELCEYTVPDNWWHDSSYHNVPLDVYMGIIKNAIRNGYTIVIGGDVSEAGIDAYAKAAIIPTFDIPPEYIDEDAKQFRFSNGTTEDDHGIHLIGYLNKNGKDWYLIKDSGAGAFNVGDKGYFFYHEDYVKLKIVDFMIHKDAVKDVLTKFKK